MKTFFTADSHFSVNDKHGVIDRDFRPFTSLKQMNKTIIKVWNKQAGKGDLIYHLGDFVNYNKLDNKYYIELYSLVKKIKADVVLICGNNEQRVIEKEFGGDFEKFKWFLIKLGFKDVIEKGLLLENFHGIKLYLNHYPSKHKVGMENLFGHVHGQVLVKRYGFNVGLDNHYLGLFSEDEVLQLISWRTFFDENVYK
ncbi:MAG: metallophosphoesterase [Clostridia bacterium]|nr:metallophosphoesterase [Clostridia bacterium]